jgi:hypothetical protein
MQWDTISDQWIWICAAGAFAVFVGAFAGYSFYKPKPHERANLTLQLRTAGRQLGESIL